MTNDPACVPKIDPISNWLAAIVVTPLIIFGLCFYIKTDPALNQFVILLVSAFGLFVFIPKKIPSFHTVCHELSHYLGFLIVKVPKDEIHLTLIPKKVQDYGSNRGNPNVSVSQGLSAPKFVAGALFPVLTAVLFFGLLALCLPLYQGVLFFLFCAVLATSVSDLYFVVKVLVSKGIGESLVYDKGDHLEIETPWL